MNHLTNYLSMSWQTHDDKSAIDIAIQYGADEAVMNALFNGSGKGNQDAVETKQSAFLDGSTHLYMRVFP